MVKNLQIYISLRNVFSWGKPPNLMPTKIYHSTVKH